MGVTQWPGIPSLNLYMPQYSWNTAKVSVKHQTIDKPEF